MLIATWQDCAYFVGPLQSWFSVMSSLYGGAAEASDSCFLPLTERMIIGYSKDSAASTEKICLSFSYF